MITIIHRERKLPIRRLKEFITDCARKLHCKGDLTILLTDGAEVRRLNRKYRKKNASTDVLAFPFHEELPDGFYLGDIAISLPKAREQARENVHSLEKELMILMLHGLLHLQGHDHETDKGQMLQLQSRLIQQFTMGWK